MSERLTEQVLEIILGDPFVTAVVGVGLLALATLFIFGKDIAKMKGLGPLIVIVAAVGAIAVTVVVGSLFLDVFKALFPT